MAIYEYRVVPAPTRGQKGKAAKGSEGRFAHAIELLMNEMAAEGWEYQRAETLPHEERAGLTSTTVTYRNVLVFRRPRPGDVAQFRPRLLETEEAQTPLALPELAEPGASKAGQAGGEPAPADASTPRDAAGTDARGDEGGEATRSTDHGLSVALRRRASQLLGRATDTGRSPTAPGDGTPASRDAAQAVTGTARGGQSAAE